MKTESRTLKADIAVIGGGVGGCAAALAALEAGRTVVLTEEHAWIGGQLTSQLTPPDEHGWIERFGRTRRYQEFREAVRQHYRQHYPLTDAARENPRLNPGNGWVSPLCHEPRVALAVLTSRLAPFQAQGRLQLMTRQVPVAASLQGADVVASVTVEACDTGVATRIVADYFIDATELGDLLVLANVEHVTGQEAKSDTGEPSAPAKARPGNMQACSWCFALEHVEGQNHVGAPPATYDFWRNYRAPLTPPWPDRWLSWSGMSPRTLQPVRYNFFPHGEKPVAFAGLWTYRRILDRAQFRPGAFASDVVVVNWPMIDYLPKSLLAESAGEREAAKEGARELSRSALHWMQTEAPRPDGGIGWPGLRLRGDVAGTGDGLAMAPYVREARRIRAEFTIREQDVSAATRPGAVLGESYADSVGVGFYRIDLHPTLEGDNYLDVDSLPFQIPLGALLPVRMENLLPAAKNLGTTHITNGCYRVHPVEWNIGEAAGTLAAYCVERKVRPRAVWRSAEHLRTLQAALERSGVELRWPETLRLEDGDPHAHMPKS